MAFGKLGARGGFGSFGVLGRVGTASPPATPFWTLPTAPVSGLAVWSDYKKNSNFIYKDTTLGLSTFNALEDMTGNAYGFFQPYRTDGANLRQPVTGALSAAPYFTGVTSLDCASTDLFNGQSKVTIGAAFSVDSTFTPVANRTIFENGTAAAAVQIGLGLVGTGGSAGKLRVVIRPNATGTQYVSATTGTVVSNDAKHTMVVEIDITSGATVINIYLDGANYLVAQTFVPSTNVFTTVVGGIRLGNDNAVQSTPLGGEVLGVMGYFGAFDSTKRSAMTTYLASL